MPLRMSFSVMICKSLLELGQTTIERARGDALAHRFDTDALLVGEKYKYLFLIGKEIELIPTVARRHNHVLRSALWFEYDEEKIDTLDTPSTVCIMRLKGGQVHMNLIVRHCDW